MDTLAHKFVYAVARKSNESIANSTKCMYFHVIFWKDFEVVYFKNMGYMRMKVSSRNDVQFQLRLDRRENCLPDDLNQG